MRAGKVGAVVKGGASGSALGWLGACRSRTGGWEVGWAGRLGARWGDKGVATAEFASEGGRGGGGEGAGGGRARRGRGEAGSDGSCSQPAFLRAPPGAESYPFPGLGSVRLRAPECQCVRVFVSPRLPCWSP